LKKRMLFLTYNIKHAHVVLGECRPLQEVWLRTECILVSRCCMNRSHTTKKIADNSSSAGSKGNEVSSTRWWKMPLYWCRWWMLQSQWCSCRWCRKTCGEEEQDYVGGIPGGMLFGQSRR
jgi:hypothetical protein